MRAARLRMRDAKPHEMHSRDRRNYVSGVCARPPVKSRNDDETRWQSWWHADTAHPSRLLHAVAFQQIAARQRKATVAKVIEERAAVALTELAARRLLGLIAAGSQLREIMIPFRETVPAGSARVQDAHAQAGAGPGCWRWLRLCPSSRHQPSPAAAARESIASPCRWHAEYLTSQTREPAGQTRVHSGFAIPEAMTRQDFVRHRVGRRQNESVFSVLSDVTRAHHRSSLRRELTPCPGGRIIDTIERERHAPPPPAYRAGCGERWFHGAVIPRVGGGSAKCRMSIISSTFPCNTGLPDPRLFNWETVVDAVALAEYLKIFNKNMRFADLFSLWSIIWGLHRGKDRQNSTIHL